MSVNYIYIYSDEMFYIPSSARNRSRECIGQSQTMQDDWLAGRLSFVWVAVSGHK